MPNGIIIKLQQYCDTYNIPIEHIVDVISDLKVIPMIRGKAFEFTVTNVLKNFLPQSRWKVEHLNIQAQPGTHDIDVAVTKLSSTKRINIECKLAKNNSFQIKGNSAMFRVKCMRSRTVSDNAMATRMARNYRVSRELILMHADSYREQDFDFVITSLGNSFWETKNNIYTFNGNISQFNLLKKLFPSRFSTFNNFQKDTFKFLLFARSKDIVVSTRNGLSCQRRKCIKNGTGGNCGFIPNYPIVSINDVANGRSPWKLIETAERKFNNFLT